MPIEVIPKDDVEFDLDFEIDQPNEYVAGAKAISRQWLIDIGANMYIYTNKMFFNDYYKYGPKEKPYSQYTISPNSIGKSLGRGTIKISILVLDGKINKISF